MATWRLTDLTTSVVQYPTLASISVSNEQPCQLAVLSCRIVDEPGTLVIANKHEYLYEFADDNVNFVRIFAGDANNVVRTDMGRSEPRVYEITAQDYTKRLVDNVIDAERKREESVSARVAWIMGYSTQGFTTSIASISTLVDPRDYRGMSVRQALDDVAAEVGASFYVDFSKVFRFFVTPPVIAAPFALAHPANPPTSHPYWDFALSSSSDEYAEAVYVQGDGVALWRGTRGDYERSISDPSIKTTRRARNVGDRMLIDLANPVRTVRLTLTKPGLEPGQTVHLTYPDWGIAENFLVQAVQLSALDPNGPGGGQMMVNVTLADRFTPCSLRSPSASDNPREGTAGGDEGGADCSDCAKAVVGMDLDENISLATGRHGMIHVHDGERLRKYNCGLLLVDGNDNSPTPLGLIRHEAGTHTALGGGDRGLYLNPSVGPYGDVRWSVPIDPASFETTDRRTYWVATEGASLIETFGRTVASGWGTSEIMGLHWFGPAETSCSDGPTGLHSRVENDRGYIYDGCLHWLRLSGWSSPVEILIRTRLTPEELGNFHLNLEADTVENAAIRDGDLTDAYVLVRVRRLSGGGAFPRVQVEDAAESQSFVEDEWGGSVDFSGDMNAWYWLRVMVDTTSAQARIWKDGDAEPGSWQAQVTGVNLSGFISRLSMLGIGERGFMAHEIDSIEIVSGQGSGGAAELQRRSEVDGALLASTPLSQTADDMRRTPSGQHVFVKQGNDTLERYSRAPALEDTVTISGFFPNDDWNVDDAFGIYRLAGDVLYKYNPAGTLVTSIDLGAAHGYAFPTNQEGNGHQLYTGKASGTGGATDAYLRVVGSIGGDACLLTIRRSDLAIESVRRFGDGDAEAKAIIRFGMCVYVAGSTSAATFEDEDLDGKPGWLMRIPAGNV